MTLFESSPNPVVLTLNNTNSILATSCFLLLCPIKLLNPLTERKAVVMAEWNAYYHNEDEEEEQEEGQQSGGEMEAALPQCK